MCKDLAKGLVFALLFGTSAGINSQSLDLRGQISTWLNGHLSDGIDPQYGMRYIPGAFIEKQFKDNYTDAQLSFNFYNTGVYHGFDDIENDINLKAYRLWLRYVTPQFEARLGLQKINFGSAMYFRPLMWFDQIDPRDPLQLTDGVYALLLRYYFLNNANIWLWGLYGNNATKGWEMFPTDKYTPEIGGRFQIPFYTGEMGFTYHHRKAMFSAGYPFRTLGSENPFDENRFGLDGKWDLGIGFWFETTIVHQEFDFIEQEYRSLFTLGSDYTFEFGNGPHIAIETMRYQLSQKLLGGGDKMTFSAISCSYPLGLVDRITGMVYYDWDQKNWYRFANWQRQYDNWLFYFIGFWNPDQALRFQAQYDSNPFAGRGIQLMVVYNH